MPSKETIIKSISSGTDIPTGALQNYISSGTITLDEMLAAGLNPDKASEIKNALKGTDDNLWQECSVGNNVEDYRKYLSESRLLLHDQEAYQAIANLESQLWSEISSAPTEAGLNKYIEEFPRGQHVDECRRLLADLPWLKTREQNTIAAYEEYMCQYPGKHDDEARISIDNIKDDNAWKEACEGGRKKHLKRYLELFPNGRHAQEAKRKIVHRSADEQFLDRLEEDPNAELASDIQDKVNDPNNSISWNDIKSIFGEAKKTEIKDYKKIEIDSGTAPPAYITSPTTEVYFWGTPSSGKTCVLGALLSSARANGVLNPISSSDDYGKKLSNLYTSGNFCSIQEGTPITEIHEIPIELKGSKELWHRLSLVDLAGELFRAVYEKKYGSLVPGSQREQLLKIAMNYLNNRANKRIHFFIVEYGAEDNKWENVYMHDYLENMIDYLDDAKVLHDTTEGVYVLVTKCDIIDCDGIEDADRDKHIQKEAERYVMQGQRLAGFWTKLVKVCKYNKIADLEIVPFSIGEVFAQRLCIPDPKYTGRVIKKLLEKTHTTKSGCFVINWLRN